MNTSNRTFICLFVLVLGFTCFYTKNVQASAFQFTRSLQVGMTGDDVQELQKILNSNPITQVNAFGIGSSGQESLYFGQLTRQAVIRFQEMYKNDILTPIGLSSGTGFVGPATIKMLNQSDKIATITQSNSSLAPSLAQQGLVKPMSSNTGATSTPTQPTTPISTPVNPNLEHIDDMFAVTDSIAIKQGLPTLTFQMKDQIRKDLSTTTNLREKFVELARKSISQSGARPAGVVGIMQDSFSKLIAFLSPNKARAQVGTDFGTNMITSVMPCTCSGNIWLIYMSPLPPTFPVLLSYTMGTQMFMNYTAIGATQLLGKYSIGTQMCYMYAGTACTVYPTEGWITPFLGSS